MTDNAETFDAHAEGTRLAEDAMRQTKTDREAGLLLLDAAIAAHPRGAEIEASFLRNAKMIRLGSARSTLGFMYNPSSP